MMKKYIPALVISCAAVYMSFLSWSMIPAPSQRVQHKAQRVQIAPVPAL